MTSSKPRPAHRARYDVPARARDARLGALAALGLTPRGAAPRHRATDVFAPVARDLRAADYSLAELMTAPAGGAR
jgi:hypothetical protein